MKRISEMAFLSLFIGFAAARFGILRSEQIKFLNKLVIWIILPAVILSKLHAIPFDVEMVKLASAMWVTLLFSVIFWLVISKIFSFKKETTAALILTTGFTNTSFVGFPLIELLLGNEALKTAIIVDQLGSFFLVSSFGLLIALFFKSSKEKKSISDHIKRTLFFPPFVALIIAGTTHQLRYLNSVTIVLDSIASTISYCTLFIVGYQLRIYYPKKILKTVALGLAFRLILTPFILHFFYTNKVVILECAMAPMITSTLLAVEFDLEPELAVAMLNLGILFSFITVPIWSFLL